MRVSPCPWVRLFIHRLGVCRAAVRVELRGDAAYGAQWLLHVAELDCIA